MRKKYTLLPRLSFLFTFKNWIYLISSVSRKEALGMRLISVTLVSNARYNCASVTLLIFIKFLPCTLGVFMLPVYSQTAFRKLTVESISYSGANEYVGYDSPKHLKMIGNKSKLTHCPGSPFIWRSDVLYAMFQRYNLRPSF